MGIARNERRRIFREAMIARGTGRSKRIYAHEQVLDLAREMAHEVYAEIMERDNELYADWKKMCPELSPARCEDLFVELAIAQLLDPARAILASMLANPHFTHLHESIYDALIKDNILRQGRARDRSRPRFMLDAQGEMKRVN
jgi:hypothetical protein